MSDSNNTHTHSHAAHQSHACPLWILGAVFGVLIVLTVFTVLTAQYVDLGEYNLLLAMVIALVKGTLVALFFMHLWWDSKFNSIALVAGLAFLALFIGFTMIDTYAYQNTVEPLNKTLKLEPAAAGGESHSPETPAAGEKNAEPAH